MDSTEMGVVDGFSEFLPTSDATVACGTTIASIHACGRTWPLPAPKVEVCAVRSKPARQGSLVGARVDASAAAAGGAEGKRVGVAAEHIPRRCSRPM